MTELVLFTKEWFCTSLRTEVVPGGGVCSRRSVAARGVVCKRPDARCPLLFRQEGGWAGAPGVATATKARVKELRACEPGLAWF